MTFLRSWGLPFALSFLLSASALAMYQKVGVELGIIETLANYLCFSAVLLFPFRLQGRKQFALIMGLLGLWFVLVPLLAPFLSFGSSVLISLPLAAVTRIGFSLVPAQGITIIPWLLGSALGIAIIGMLGLTFVGSTKILWGLGGICLCSALCAMYRWRTLPGSWFPSWSWMLGTFACCVVLFASIPTGIGIFLFIFLLAAGAIFIVWNRSKLSLPPTFIIPCITACGIAFVVFDAVKMLDCLAQRPPLWISGLLLLTIVMLAIGLLIGSFLLRHTKKPLSFLVPGSVLGLYLWALALLVPWEIWSRLAFSMGETSFSVVFAWICSLGFLGLGLVCVRPMTMPQWNASLPLIVLASLSLHRIFPGWRGNILMSLFLFSLLFCLLFWSSRPWKKVLAPLPLILLLTLYVFLPPWPKGLENSTWTLEGLRSYLDDGYRLNRLHVGSQEQSGASQLIHLPFLVHPNSSATVGLITYDPFGKYPNGNHYELTARLHSSSFQSCGERSPRPWLRDHPAAFDILIVSPDEDRRPEILAGADGLAILKNSLSDQGILCFIFPIDRVSVKELQARIAGFVKVFPSSCSLWTQGGFLALIGSKKDAPLKIDPRRWEVALKNEGVRQDLSWSDFGGEGSYLSRPENFFAGFLCGAETLRFLCRGVKPLSGDLTPASRPKEAPVEPLIKILVEHLDPIAQAFAGAPPAWTNQAEEHRSRYLLPELQANRALIHAQRMEIWGQAAQADGLRENAARINPRNLIARALVGRTMLLSGRLKEAREILEAVLVEDPKHFQVLMFMATLSMMEKDPAKADDYLAKAVISAPKNSQALMTLAQMRLGAGKNAEALKLAQRAAAISPEDPQIQHTLAQTLVANGDKTQAIVIWRELLKDPTLSSELLITIANTIQTLDPGLGLEFANRCHSLSPENPWTMLMLARLQFLNKQTDQAKKNCAEAKRQAQSLGDARLQKACETLEIELLRPKS